MAGVINPVVYGGSRRRLWPFMAGLFVISQAAGAVCTGVIVASLGIALRCLVSRAGFSDAGVLFAVPEKLLVLFIGSACVPAALRELGLFRFAHPSTRWQVPSSWRRFGPITATTLYGFVIGLGVATRIPHSTFYVVLLVCLGSANPWLGAGLMAIYGITRAAITIWIAAGEAKVVDRTERTGSVMFFAPLVGYANGMALAFVGGMMIGLWASLV